MKHVDVDFVPRDWWIVANAAERRGLTVRAFLVEASLAIAGRTVEAQDAIVRLHGQGLCDADIAARLSSTPGSVATRRRRLNLPPNKRFKKAQE